MELGYYQSKSTGRCVKVLMIAEHARSGGDQVVYVTLDRDVRKKIFTQSVGLFLELYWQITHNYDEHRPCDLCGLLRNGTRPEQPIFEIKRKGG